MTYAEKLRLLCPMHRIKKLSRRKGFACRCEALSEAFAMGYRAIRHTRRTQEKP